MKILKFLGWVIISFVILIGLALWFLPTIGRILITQELTERGFTNVVVHLDYPSAHAWTIPSLAFRTPEKLGEISISIDNTTITYSLDSVLNKRVETINIEHMKIGWNSSLLARRSAPSQASAPPSTDSQFDFPKLEFGTTLPILPFQHLRIENAEMTNPQAPPTLRHISMSASLEALPSEYNGTVNLYAEDIPMDLLTFSVTNSGIVSFKGEHTDTLDSPVFFLETVLDAEPPHLQLKGKTTINLQPFIHTIATLYPLPAEYQSVAGSFSGSWASVNPKPPSSADSFFGPIQGNFAFNIHMPTWAPFGRDIKAQTQGTFFLDGPALRIAIEPSSAGSVDLPFDSFLPPALVPIIAHKGFRSFKWNLLQPVHLVVPLKQNPKEIKIPNGQIQIVMHNSFEELDMTLAAENLAWEPTNGVTGRGNVSFSAQLKPRSTPSLQLEHLSLKAKITIEISEDSIEVALKPSFQLRLKNLRNETIHIPTFISRFPEGLFWTYHKKSKKLGIANFYFHLHPPVFFTPGPEMGNW